MFQPHIKKLSFQSCNLNKDSGLCFKFLFKEQIDIYHLNLNDNNLLDEGLQHILDALKKCPQNDVRVIRCNNNKLTSLCTVRLAHILKRKKGRLPPIKLQLLTMRDNQIGNMGVENISSFLKTNNTIKYLDLSFCSLHDKSLEILSESLKYNKCIRYLNLLGNEFSDMGLLGMLDMLIFRPF